MGRIWRLWKRTTVRAALALGLLALLVGPGCLVIIPADGGVPQVEIRRPLVVPCTPVPPVIVVPPCVTATAVPTCPPAVPSPTCPTAAAATRAPMILTATPAAPPETCPPTAPPCPSVTWP